MTRKVKGSVGASMSIVQAQIVYRVYSPEETRAYHQELARRKRRIEEYKKRVTFNPDDVL